MLGSSTLMFYSTSVGAHDTQTQAGGTSLQPPADMACEEQTSWDQWNLAEYKELSHRWAKAMDNNVELSTSKNLIVDLTYTVSDDGSVSNVQVARPSGNSAFDALAEKVVQDMAHAVILKFPDKSSKKQILKKAEFYTPGSRAREGVFECKW